MVKTNIHNKININVTQETKESKIPVHIKRGVGIHTVRESNKPKHDRRQDHGTRGNRGYGKQDDYYGIAKSALVEEAISLAVQQELLDLEHPNSEDDSYVITDEDRQDFDLWEQQMDDLSNAHISTRFTTSELAELEQFHQWLLKRTKKS